MTKGYFCPFNCIDGIIKCIFGILTRVLVVKQSHGTYSMFEPVSLLFL